MAGTALENFTDFVKFTGPVYFTGPEEFLNEAVKQTYSLSRMLRGKGMDKVLQSGEQINDDIMFDDSRTFLNYKPNQEFTWTQPQVATEVRIPWRFSVDHMSWTDHEIELNINAGFSRRYANVQYKNLRKKIEQRMWTSAINGMEEKIWQTATGNTAEMETTSGGEQYSIPSFVTEDDTNFHANGWTNVMGVDPASEIRWRNQLSAYDFDDPDDSDGDNDGLIDAFDEMITKVMFIPPEFHQEHFEPLNLQSSRQAIYCSRAGLNLYKRLLRAANDTLVQKQDAAYNAPQFSGIDLVYLTVLDAGTAASGGTGHIFDWLGTTNGTGTTSYDEDGNDTAGTAVTNAVDGNRYWWINGNYLTPVFHSSRYFFKKDPFFLEKQPYTWVTPVDIWWNLFNHSRQRQGMVAPQAP